MSTTRPTTTEAPNSPRANLDLTVIYVNARTALQERIAGYEANNQSGWAERDGILPRLRAEVDVINARLAELDAAGLG